MGRFGWLRVSRVHRTNLSDCAVPASETELGEFVLGGKGWINLPDVTMSISISVVMSNSLYLHLQASALICK